MIGPKLGSQFDGARRRGFTLVELMVVLSIFGLLTGIIAKWTIQSIQARRMLQQSVEDSMALHRLDRSLREDASRSIQWQKEDVFRFLSHAGIHAEYLLVDGGVQRKLFRGNEVASRDWYRLPRGYVMQWPAPDVLASSQAGKLIEFRLTPSEGDQIRTRSIQAESWIVVVSCRFQPGKYDEHVEQD